MTANPTTEEPLPAAVPCPIDPKSDVFPSILAWLHWTELVVMEYLNHQYHQSVRIHGDKQWERALWDTFSSACEMAQGWDSVVGRFYWIDDVCQLSSESSHDGVSIPTVSMLDCSS